MEMGIELLEKIDYEPRPFVPARWLPGAHAQTAAGRLLRSSRGVAFRRERVETPDGDFVDLDFVAAPGRPWPERGGPPFEGALILHGLEGCSRSGYVLQAARVLTEVGIRSVVLNFRSCSGEPNRLARSYNAGDTGDVRRVVDHLHERFPNLQLTAVGFSLGGNVLLKHLGEEGTESKIRAAVAISVPYDLVHGAEMLDRPAGRVYARIFLRSLRAKVAGKGALLTGSCDVERGLAARSIRAFDDAVTAPLHGFADAEEYYRASSSTRFLDAIRVPTLLLQAKNDPFLSAAALPNEAVAANPALGAVFLEHGGHVGFVQGAPWRPHFWAEAEAARFLRAALSNGSGECAATPENVQAGRE